MQFKRDKKQNSNKLNYDKYYTDKQVAERLIKTTFDVLKDKKITEIVEPSAGTGSFSGQLENCIAYDIDPKSENIIKMDFLKTDLKYKKGRLFIGNPPFGDRLNLARKFMKKHYKEGDYIAYILPISQYENNFNFYEFDLVYSEDLGVLLYSDREVYCCFNIYVRPSKGLNTRTKLYELPKWLKIEERRESVDIKRRKEYTETPDIRVCSWGNAGKVLENEERYAKELGIYAEKHKEEVVDFFKSFNYTDMLGSNDTISPNITIWRMKQHLIENFLKPNNLYDIGD